jgi:signal transduction histidine kinase
VNAALGVGLGLMVLLTGAARRLPELPCALTTDDPELTTTAFSANGTPEVVSEIRTRAQREPFRLKAVDLIEEPDVLGSWTELDDFFARQGQLWRRLREPDVEFRVAGVWRAAPVRARRLTDLPFAFYAQLIAPLAAWVVGFATYAFSNRGLAARIYALSAVAFGLAVWPAALYSTRPLALEPGLFRLLSTANHAGGFLYAAGVIHLLAVYPVRLMRPTLWIWLIPLVGTLAGHYQWAAPSIAGFYAFNALQFVLFMVVAVWQWRASRPDPILRATVGWMLLSMFVGVIFFVVLITLPVLLGAHPAISQSLGMVCIVFMYAGISLGVLRVRLFDLDRWWFRTWSWILSGAVVLGADLMLTRLFSVRRELALVIALIVVGWVYFPIRQELFQRFAKIGWKAPAFDASKLIAAVTHGELRARFTEALRSSFSPLEIVESADSIVAPRLSAEGAWLEVPSPLRDGLFRCHFRENGARLFSREDVSQARDLLTLSESVRVAIDARAEGETTERTRIRRDLHDDLGASIIRIAHESHEPRSAELAKAAMRDLRDVLAALQDAPSACADVLDDLEADLRARAQADGRTVEWMVRAGAHHVLSARSRANLTRALRESTTNALKHGFGTIRYEFELCEAELRASVENGAADQSPMEVGMGIGNIRSRLEELGGSADFSRENGVFQLRLRLPWSKEP